MRKTVFILSLFMCMSTLFAQNNTLYLWKNCVQIHTHDGKKCILPGTIDSAKNVICEIPKDDNYLNCSISRIYLGNDWKGKGKLDFQLTVPNDTAKNHTDNIVSYSDLSFNIADTCIIVISNSKETIVYKLYPKKNESSLEQDTTAINEDASEEVSPSIPLWVKIIGAIVVALAIAFFVFRQKIITFFKKKKGNMEENVTSDGQKESVDDDSIDSTGKAQDASETTLPQEGESISREVSDKPQQEQQDYDSLKDENQQLKDKIADLETKIGESKVNDTDIQVVKSNEKQNIYEELAGKIRRIPEFKDNIVEKFIVDNLTKDNIEPLLSKLFTLKLECLFKSDKYDELSRMWKNHTDKGMISDENKFLYDLNAAIKKSNSVQTNRQQQLPSSYYSLSADQKKQISGLVWGEFSKTCKVNHDEFHEVENLDAIIGFFKTQYNKVVANSNIDKIIIEKAKSSELPAAVISIIVEKIAKEINNKVKADDLRISSTTQDELVSQITNKINEPLSPEKVDAIIEQKAENLSKQKIADIQKEADNKLKSLEAEITQSNSNAEVLSKKLVQKEKDIEKLEKEKQDALNNYECQKEETAQKHQKEIDEYTLTLQKAEERHHSELETLKKAKDEASDNYRRQKEETAQKHQKEIDELKASHTLTLQKAEEKRLSDLDNLRKVSQEEKNRAVDAISQEKKIVENNLASERDSHSADLVKLKNSMSAYIGLIKSTLDHVQAAIRASYSNGNDDSKLSDFVNKNIINNKIYSFEDFESELNNVLANTENIELDGLRSKLRDCFVGCLDMKMPTWLDVLARLYLYSNVGFISAQFASKGISLTRVGESFLATNTVLSQIGVELIMPKLFSDSYNEDKYDLKDIRNIDSYVDDIASHVSSTNEIIDLYTVGYKVDGELKEKPIVSKF